MCDLPAATELVADGPGGWGVLVGMLPAHCANHMGPRRSCLGSWPCSLPILSIFIPELYR